MVLSYSRFLACMLSDSPTLYHKLWVSLYSHLPQVMCWFLVTRSLYSHSCLTLLWNERSVPGMRSSCLLIIPFYLLLSWRIQKWAVTEDSKWHWYYIMSIFGPTSNHFRPWLMHIDYDSRITLEERMTKSRCRRRGQIYSRTFAYVIHFIRSNLNATDNQ